MTNDPEAAAVARAEAERRRLRAENILLSAEMLAWELGTKAGAVDELRRQGALLAVDVDGAWRFPSWQVREGQLLVGLADVLRAVATIPLSLGSWAALDFLTAPDATTDGASIAHLLRVGWVDEALTVVRHYGEMGR